MVKPDLSPSRIVKVVVWLLMASAGLSLATSTLLVAHAGEQPKDDADYLLRSSPIMNDTDAARDAVGMDLVIPADSPDYQEGMAAGKEMNEQAAATVAGVTEKAATQLDPQYQRPVQKGVSYVLFASQSMGTAALQQAVALSQQRDDLIVVFRGMKPNQTLGDLVRTLRDISVPVKEGDVAPKINIDPPLFLEANVTTAPTLVRQLDGVITHQARGVIFPAYIESRLDDTKDGDLGKAGPTFNIVEQDLMTVMQEKANKIDWQAQAESARDRFWSQQVMPALPHATQGRVREIDPSFVVTRGLSAPDGTVIAVAGQRVNPLEHAPFTQQLVIFDATDPKQLAFARARAIDGAARDQRITLMATDFDRAGGWDSWHALANELQRDVYILPDPLRERFHIERVPTTVDAEGLHFRVVEYGPTELSEAAP